MTTVAMPPAGTITVLDGVISNLIVPGKGNAECIRQRTGIAHGDCITHRCLPHRSRITGLYLCGHRRLGTLERAAFIEW